MSLIPPILALLCAALTAQAADYAIVVSGKTNADPQWHTVVEALREKHGAMVIEYSASVGEALPDLRTAFPRYACFVATPAEAGHDFVASVHQLTRHLDDDPYTDCLWAILTGYDAANALNIAQHREPLTVRKAAAGTAIALEMLDEGICFDELKKGYAVKKSKGANAQPIDVPGDTTVEIVKTVNEGDIDLFVTSGHATTRDWQIGFAYRNGQFRCADGALYGLDTAEEIHPISSPRPKIYMPVGNCLMGNIDGSDAMALAFMNSGGVKQMLGYTVESWYGFGGWGCLDSFVEQPGRFTLAEAVYANHQALLHRIATCYPHLIDVELDSRGNANADLAMTDAAREFGLDARDIRGLLYDRDVIAFYGDPAWEARMAPRDCAWDQTLIEKDGVFTFELKPRKGADSFQPINTNGSTRGGRPVFQFLPHRVRDVEIVEGADLKPVVTDNFLLIPLPKTCDPTRTYRVAFRAQAVKAE